MSGRRAALGLACSIGLCLVLLGGCQTSEPGGPSASEPSADGATPDGGAGDTKAPTGGPRADLPYAWTVESFEPGQHAGFGQDRFPDVVLGPPLGDSRGGSLDVLSLGVGGEIVLGFGARRLVDGPGPDFIVFENAFFFGGDRVFAEAGEVAVSEDGVTWVSFPCEAPASGNDPGPGCAGGTPTADFDAEAVIPLDPKQTGGDAFDLSDLGVAQARFVRIRDRAQSGSGTSGGFDLDAVGLIHFNQPDDRDPSFDRDGDAGI